MRVFFRMKKMFRKFNKFSLKKVTILRRNILTKRKLFLKRRKLFRINLKHLYNFSYLFLRDKKFRESLRLCYGKNPFFFEKYPYCLKHIFYRNSRLVKKLNFSYNYFFRFFKRLNFWKFTKKFINRRFGYFFFTFKKKYYFNKNYLRAYKRKFKFLRKYKIRGFDFGLSLLSFDNFFKYLNSDFFFLIV